MAKEELHESMLMGQLLDGKAQDDKPRVPLATPVRSQVQPPAPAAFAPAAHAATAAADLGNAPVLLPAPVQPQVLPQPVAPEAL